MFRISILHPDYSWHTPPTVEQLQQRLFTAPKIPHLRGVAPFWLQRLVGSIHIWLKSVSAWYCRWYGIRCPGQIWQLPFGLLLKHSDGTRIEEIVTTRAMYDAGMTVPRIISYGAHPDMPHAPCSILMTRLPGEPLFRELWEWLTPEAKQTTMQQLRDTLHFVHGLGRHPTAESKLICSIQGTSIRSIRVPFTSMPPCSDQSEFNQRLVGPAEWESDMPDYETRMESVNNLHTLSHDVVFTHGDFAPRNVMVMDDGRVSGLIDWEAAGYYPTYWEFTTAWRFSTSGWWFEIVRELADGKYDRERRGDSERWMLTTGTMLG